MASIASSTSSRRGRRRSILKASRNSVEPTDFTDRVRGVGFNNEEEDGNGNENNTTNLLPLAARKRVSFGHRQVKEFQIQTSYTESPISSILQDANQSMVGEVDMDMSFGLENVSEYVLEETVYGGNFIEADRGDNTVNNQCNTTFRVSKNTQHEHSGRSVNMPASMLDLNLNGTVYGGNMEETLHRINSNSTFRASPNHHDPNKQTVSMPVSILDGTVYGGNMNLTLNRENTIPIGVNSTFRVPPTNAKSFNSLSMMDGTVFGGNMEETLKENTTITDAKSKYFLPNIILQDLNRTHCLDGVLDGNEYGRNTSENIPVDMNNRTYYGGNIITANENHSIFEESRINSKTFNKTVYGGIVDTSPSASTIDPCSSKLNKKSNIMPRHLVQTRVASSASGIGELVMSKNPDLKYLPKRFPKKLNESKPKKAIYYGKFNSVKTPKRPLLCSSPVPQTSEVAEKVEKPTKVPIKHAQLISTMAQTSFGVGIGYSVDVQTSPMVFHRPQQEAMISIGTSPMENKPQRNDVNETSTLKQPGDQIKKRKEMEQSEDEEINRSYILPIQEQEYVDKRTETRETSLLIIEQVRDEEINRSYILPIQEQESSVYKSTETRETSALIIEQVRDEEINAKSLNLTSNTIDIPLTERLRDQIINVSRFSPTTVQPVNHSMQSSPPLFTRNLDVELKSSPVNVSPKGQDRRLNPADMEAESDGEQEVQVPKTRSNSSNLSSDLVHYLNNPAGIRGVEYASLLRRIKPELREMEPNDWKDFLRVHRGAFKSQFLEAVEMSRTRKTTFKQACHDLKIRSS